MCCAKLLMPPNVDWLKVDEWARRYIVQNSSRRLLSLDKYHSVATHTNTQTQANHPWKILFSVVRSSKVREQEVGNFDVDKLPYVLVYWCGLVTFRLPHPDYNDIVHGHLVGFSLILAQYVGIIFFLAARRVLVTSAMSNRLKSHYQSCRRTAVPHRNVFHIRIIRFSNWIK